MGNDYQEKETLSDKDTAIDNNAATSAESSMSDKEINLKTNSTQPTSTPINEKRILRAVKRFERILRETRYNQMAEYYEFKLNPRKIIFVNLVIGLSRGVGFVLGVSIVGTIALGFITWVLSSFVDIPVIGKFVADIIESADIYLKNKP